jgi:hypothetical protein
MAPQNTLPNDQHVLAFNATEASEQKSSDSYHLIPILREITGCDPIIWGPDIIGFGSYH